MHGVVFDYIDHLWNNLRKFTFRNRTVLEVFFIMLYTVEQTLLIWLTYDVKDPIKLSLIISIFATIVLTTFSLHKLVMESRIKVLETQLNETYEQKKALEDKTKKVMKEADENDILMKEVLSSDNKNL